MVDSSPVLVRVPKLYFVDRCELCVLEWGSMGETMKGPASLEFPDLRKPGTGGTDGWKLS